MISEGFPGVSAVKEFAWNAGDTGDVGLIRGQGRSLGGGDGNPLQYSHQENYMDKEPGRLWSMGSQRDRHDRSDWAAAVMIPETIRCMHFYLELIVQE